MARKGFKVTLDTSLGEGQYLVRGSSVSGDAVDTSTLSATADTISGLAGSVTGMATALADLRTAISLMVAGDAVLSYDASTVTNGNQVRRIFDEMRKQAEASGLI